MKKAKFSPKNLKISAAMPAEARKAPFWKRVLELLSAPGRSRKGVGIGKIATNAKAGAVLVVPDKVLGGNIGQMAKLTVAAVSFSVPARKAIEASGGKAVDIEEAAKQHPTGKGLIILR